MSVKVSKAFYLSCDECGLSEFEFHKDDVRRHVEKHDCEKHLTKKINYAHEFARNKFEFTVKRRV